MNFVAPQFKTKQPLHVVTFDDLRPTDRKYAMPILNERGLAGTSYVNTGRTTQNWVFSWDTAKDMILNGNWDMQCHTHNHPDLSTLNETEIRAEMELLDESFIGAGLDKPKHHAHPFGAFSELAKNVISEYRITQRNTGTGINDVMQYNNVNPMQLKGVQADLATEEDWLRVKEAIDYAFDTNGIIITYSHTITKGNITDVSQGTYDNFVAMIDYSINKGMRLVTLSQMYNILKFHGAI